jgi:hypothetical protein
MIAWQRIYGRIPRKLAEAWLKLGCTVFYILFVIRILRRNHRRAFAALLHAELEVLSQSDHAGTSVLCQCFGNGV